jgi:hypothetical protein
MDFFSSMCDVCSTEKLRKKRGKGSEPIRNTARSQLDLIDTHSPSDRQNKFVMVYQDHPNKFSLLRALENKHAE